MPGDDAAGQHRPRPLRLGDAAADAVRDRRTTMTAGGELVTGQFPQMIRDGQEFTGVPEHRA